jgi:hypothetical protein
MERYLHEVGDNLPVDRRQDVIEELRSLLADELEDRAGPEPTEEDVLALLQEQRPPRKVAASYWKHQYLIGPRWYDTFIQVLRIGLLVLVVVHLVFLGLNLAFNQSDIGGFGMLVLDDLGSIGLSALDWIGNFVQSTFMFFGIAVLVFAVLERKAGDAFEDEDQSWNPRELPKVDTAPLIKRRGEIVGIAIDAIILALLVIFRERIGIFMINPTSVEMIPIPGIQALLPWFYALLVLDIFLRIVLLSQGRWQLATRLARAALSVFTAWVFFLLLQVEMPAVDIAGVSEAMEGLDLALNMGLAAVVVVMLVDAASNVWSAIKERRAE